MLFRSEQLAIIEQKLEHHVKGLEELLEGGPDQAMNRLNRKETT